MERIRIPNDVTYFPVSLLDVALAAPLLSRVLLRASLPGRALQAAALGVYVASAAQDWLGRRGVRKIEFLETFGANVRNLEEMTTDAREAEVRALVEAVNARYTPARIPRRELAERVDRHLTDCIAGITGQRVETSIEIREFTVASLIFPFALGACDFISGDVAIFRDTGVFEPHVIAHEFTHRKGYWKELEAQAIAYLALASSGDPVLVQSALCERLHRQLRALTIDDPDGFTNRVKSAKLRPELEKNFLTLAPTPGPVAERFASVMKLIYDERMRITGQNGVRDYDVGFTNFLHTFERSSVARMRPPAKLF